MKKQMRCLNYKTARHIQDRIYDVGGGIAASVTCGNTKHPWYKTDDSMKRRIRKLTERECFRLMDVDEHYIDRMMNSGVARSHLYHAAGNSIVVSCMEHIFENLFYPQPNGADHNGQLSLF